MAQSTTKQQGKKQADAHDTPAMRQYHRFKQQHPGCILLFRMGDFYELFYDDAELAHKVLGVTLTQRTEGIPMAGVPFHSIESYLCKLLQAGYRVAICDQIQDPSEAKGVVDRDVTRVVTPGTLTDDTLLEEGQENPLAAVVFHGRGSKGSRDRGTEGARGQGAEGTRENGKSDAHQTSDIRHQTFSDDWASIAWAELSTGSFQITTLTVSELADELARIAPRELLFCETADGQTPPRVETLAQRLGCPVTGRPAWQFRVDEGRDVLKRQFRVAQLSGFGLNDEEPALAAAGPIVHYLLETQRTSEGGTLPHLRPPKRFARTDHLVIDQTSLRSLEVERTLRSESSEGALLGTMQHSVTAMGKRLLRQWLRYPRRDRATIEQRQRVVQALVEDAFFLDQLRQTLDDVQDVQRITARLAIGRASPRDLVALGQSTTQAQAVAELLADRPATQSHHERAAELVGPMRQLADQLTAACVDQPPPHLREGGLIRDGYDSELDECRSLQRDSHQWLAEYQQRLVEETGLSNLKVGFNKVFGYYIELTAANRDKAPAHWHRKQTLKNAERFITQDLKDFEGKILSAETRGIAREQTLFNQLCEQAQQHLEALHAFGALLAELDVLASFARHAVKHRYVKPTIVDEPVLHIEAGRHPVLDQMLGDQFVPNDVELSGQVAKWSSGQDEELSGAEDSATGPLDHSATSTQASLALITGPNMAGKSTYIRQAALITLLAHTGSFVPASAATVGLCDRIFTRIGASDELHAGQSTFMVEMTETANICHHASKQSLVILDEIGRGTSTLDGLSLAWAVAEHLAGRGPRCLFATHYHELTDLAQQHENIANLNVTVREWQDQVVFLHRIVPGAADRSYGIHVAKIAGLPDRIVQRADELLNQLSVNHIDATPAAESTTQKAGRDQMSLFTEYVDHPVVDQLRQLDINQLSPMQAFDVLRQMQAQIDGESDR
jgi:DNA mismatch repair protein MutS